MNESAFRDSDSASFDLHGSDVHVWCVRLDNLSTLMSSVARYLSADEQTRAGRFVFRPDRDRYIASRGVLRAILGRYLSQDPSHLLFSYNSYGKPQMDSSREASAIRFNLSHSQALALYAVARTREVGIDIECITRDVPYEDIVEQFFSSAEKDAFRRIPKDDQREWFFACWTIKEAYVKAVGTGLGEPLDRIEVTLHPGTSTASLKILGEPQQRCRWTAQLLKSVPGYIGAVVAEAGPWRLRYWHWRPEFGGAERNSERVCTTRTA